MFMVDRSYDLFTPFTTCYTFEGYVDQYFDITPTGIEVDNQILYPEAQVRKDLNKPDNGKTELTLDSNTLVYNQFRNSHFNLAGPYMISQLR